MQRILNSSTVPPGGVWRYKDDETGIIITHPYLDQVQGRAHKHRSVNNLPIPTNWEEMFEDNICRNTSTAPCAEVETGIRRVAVLTKRFSTAMLNWARSGFKLVDEETLQERRNTCQGSDDKSIARCEFFRSSAGFFGFGRCAACGCGTGLKTALLSETCVKGKWKR